MRVFFEGQPLAGALVKLTRLEHDDAPVEERRDGFIGPGELSADPSGTWLLNVVWTKPVIGAGGCRLRHDLFQSDLRLSMTELAIHDLLDTQTVAIRDVVCDGKCRHKSAEECPNSTYLVFPYRGVYMRHLGSSEAVAEANQVLFFNQVESYRISHPVQGGDACLSIRHPRRSVARAGADRSICMTARR